MYLLRIYIRSAAIQAGVAQLPYLARNARSAEVAANAPKSPVFPLALRSHLRPYSPRRPSSEWPTMHSPAESGPPGCSPILKRSFHFAYVSTSNIHPIRRDPSRVAQLPYLARNARSAEVEANAPKSPVFFGAALTPAALFSASAFFRVSDDSLKGAAVPVHRSPQWTESDRSLCSSRVAVFIASRRRASGDLTH